MRLELLSHQAEFLADRTSTYLGLVSGFGGGKTYTLALKAIDASDKNYPTPFLFFEPTYVMVERVALPTFEKIFTAANVWHRCEYNSKKQQLTAPVNGKTIRILFGNGLDPQRQAGTNLCAIGLDEASQYSPGVFDMCLSRLREPGEYRQLCAVGTPEGYGGPFHEIFELDPQPNSRLIRAKTTDNLFLPDGYVDAMLARYSDDDKRRYINGEFIASGGKVYTEFDRNRHLRPCVDLDSGQYVMGCDFGTGCMAWCFGLVVGDVVHIWGEQVLEGSHTYEAAQKALDTLSERYSEHLGRRVTKQEAAEMTTVYADPAGSSTTHGASVDIKTMRNAGFHVLYRPRHPPVADRISSVQHKLMRDELFIDEKAAPYHARCIAYQSFGKDGKPEKGRPRDGAKGLDHGADAIGYLVEYEWPIAGVGIRSYNFR